MEASALITLLLGLLDRAAAIGALIGKAHSEGRGVTSAELAALDLDDAVARVALVQAIANAKASEAGLPPPAALAKK